MDRKVIRQTVFRVAAALLVLAVIYLGISAYVAIKAVNVQREPVTESPVGMVYENVSFPSRVDNITLRGWYVPGGDSCIIIVTGGWDNRSNPTVGTLELTKDLVDCGFSVLLFDKRGRGESDGKAKLLIHTDKDLGGVVDYVRSRGHLKTYLLGFSAGAASSIIFASENYVAAVVSDTCFAEVPDMLVRGMVEQCYPEWFAKVFSPGAFLVTRIVYGYKPVNPIDVVSDVDCPILFVHGEADHFIPVDNAYNVYQASDNPLDELWVVPGADHCQGYNTDPTGYVDRLIDFFEE